MRKIITVTLMFVLLITLCSCNTPTEEITDSESAKALLAFDDRAWKDYVALYSTYVSLVDNMAAYDSGLISKSDFYDKLVEIEKSFQDASLSFDYGEIDEDLRYSKMLKAATTYYQLATQNMMDYLNSSNDSDLSLANENLRLGTEALLSIGSKRQTIMLKAGLDEEKIQKKIDDDMNNLPSFEKFTNN